MLPDGSQLWAVSSYFMLVIKSCSDVSGFFSVYGKSRAYNPVIEEIIKCKWVACACFNAHIFFLTFACARFSIRMCMWHWTFNQANVSVEHTIKKKKKPFEDFASHPLYSISRGKLSQWTKKCCCKWVSWEKKKEEWNEELGVREFLRVSQSHWIQSGQRVHSFPQVCSKYQGRECVISNTHAKSLSCVEMHACCTHTELNTYNKVVALPLALQPS